MYVYFIVCIHYSFVLAALWKFLMYICIKLICAILLYLNYFCLFESRFLHLL